jgi:hypothetical protein
VIQPVEEAELLGYFPVVISHSMELAIDDQRFDSVLDSETQIVNLLLFAFVVHNGSR